MPELNGDLPFNQITLRLETGLSPIKDIGSVVGFCLNFLHTDIDRSLRSRAELYGRVAWG